MDQNSAAMENYFKQMAEQPDEGGPNSGSFFEPGDYRCTVKSVNAYPNAYKGFNVTLLVRIDEARQTDAARAPLPVGTTAKCIFKPNDAGERGTMGKLNLQRFVKALFGLPDSTTPEQIKQAAMQIVTPNQPAKGMALRVQGFMTKTRKGEMICVQSYEHDPKARDVAEIQRRRAELDAAG